MTVTAGDKIQRNEDGIIVEVLCFDRPAGKCFAVYRTGKRLVRVNVDRIKSAGEKGWRLNGYTLLPR